MTEDVIRRFDQSADSDRSPKYDGLDFFKLEAQKTQKEADDVANEGQKSPSGALLGCKVCTHDEAIFGIMEKAAIAASPVLITDFDKATVKVQGNWHR